MIYGTLPFTRYGLTDGGLNLSIQYGRPIPASMCKPCSLTGIIKIPIAGAPYQIIPKPG